MRTSRSLSISIAAASLDVVAGTVDDRVQALAVPAAPFVQREVRQDERPGAGVVEFALAADRDGLRLLDRTGLDLDRPVWKLKILMRSGWSGPRADGIIGGQDRKQVIAEESQLAEQATPFLRLRAPKRRGSAASAASARNG